MGMTEDQKNAMRRLNAVVGASTMDDILNKHIECRRCRMRFLASPSFDATDYICLTCEIAEDEFLDYRENLLLYHEYRDGLIADL